MGKGLVEMSEKRMDRKGNQDGGEIEREGREGR